MVGLALTWVVVRAGAALGTRSAPFLGSYRFALGLAVVLAPLVAAAVLVAAGRGRFEQARCGTVLALGWAGTFGLGVARSPWSTARPG